MKIENLNKTQIVLLTLLVSFVTSIATGIVTVTLLDQAPPGVTQTINRIVEKTVQTIIPGENQTTTVMKEVIVKEGDLIASAVEKSLKSIVGITAVNSDGVEVPLVVGVVVSDGWYVVTDKSKIFGNRNNLMIVHNGASFPADLVFDGEGKDFAILKLRAPRVGDDKDENQKPLPTLVSATLADSNSARLGQSVVLLGGDVGSAVSTGIISRLPTKTITSGTPEDSAVETKVLAYIVTDIAGDKKWIGAPLLDVYGNVFGLSVATQEKTATAVPINEITELLLGIALAEQDTAATKLDDLTVTE